MTENKRIKINTLYGCESVKDFYYLDGYDVINANTNHVKAINYLNTKRGYPYVTLETKDSSSNKKCLMHHLIALAYIENKPYDVIEHLNDDAMDYRVENLMFSNQYQNVKRAFENGHPNRIDKIFRLKMKNGSEFIGTMKELSVKTGIPRQTIYCRFYKQTPGRDILSVTMETGQQTTENNPAA